MSSVLEKVRVFLHPQCRCLDLKENIRLIDAEIVGNNKIIADLAQKVIMHFFKRATSS